MNKAKKTKKLTIVACGGHAKVILDIVHAINAVQETYDIAGFIDDIFDCNTFCDYPYLGTTEDLMKMSPTETQVIIAIGDNDTRKKVSKALKAFEKPVLIDPTAVVRPGATLGAGTVVMPRAVINSDATVGEDCIINTAAVVEHDCQVGDWCHISPGVALAGTVKVGQGSQVGIGASVIQGINIGDDVIVGAGSVAIRDIESGVVAVGVPAKVIKKR